MFTWMLLWISLSCLFSMHFCDLHGTIITTLDRFCSQFVIMPTEGIAHKQTVFSRDTLRIIPLNLKKKKKLISSVIPYTNFKCWENLRLGFFLKNCKIGPLSLSCLWCLENSHFSVSFSALVYLLWSLPAPWSVLLHNLSSFEFFSYSASDVCLVSQFCTPFACS